jgi:hypothetical protein
VSAEPAAVLAALLVRGSRRTLLAADAIRLLVKALSVSRFVTSLLPSSVAACVAAELHWRWILPYHESQYGKNGREYQCTDEAASGADPELWPESPRQTDFVYDYSFGHPPAFDFQHLLEHIVGEQL